MRKAVQLSCLHAIWCAALPQPRTSRDQPHQYASKAVHRQIAVIVTGGIVELEVEVLSRLEKLIFNIKGPGKQNMLPIWTCIWLLMLTYRRTIERLSSNKMKSNGLALARHMYDMLVSIYSGIFRPSSPMWLNWLKDDIFELFGHDYGITHYMATLKTEIGYMCESPVLQFSASYDMLSLFFG